MSHSSQPSDSNNPTVSKVIIEILHNWNVKYLFAGMGGELLGFFDEIVRDGRIQIIDTRLESNLVFAAEGYSAVKDGPSVCIATSGPGVACLVPGIYAAWKNSAPVVCIAPFPHFGSEETHTIKDLQGVKIFPHMSKLSLQCGHVDQLPFLLNKALRVASTSPQGPVILNLNNSFFWKTMEFTPTPSERWRPTSNLTYPDPDAIRKIARVLAEAEFPAALGDTRTVWNRSSPELLELAEFLGMPVMWSHVSALRPIIPETSPLCLGEFRSPSTFAAMSSCDAMLTVDFDFDSLSTGAGHSEIGFGKKTLPETLVQIDSDPAMVPFIYPIKAGALANSKIALAQLLKEVKSFPIKKDLLVERTERVSRIRAKWLEMLNEEYRKGYEKTPMSPIVPAIELSKALAPNAIVSLAGATNSFHYKTLGVSMSSRPGSVLHFGYDLTFGGGVGRAIGAKLAEPDTQVAAFVGDGEFWYGGIPELETVARLKLPITTVISNNYAMGDDKFVQMVRFGGRYPAAEMQNPDFSVIAKAFGMYAERVEDAREVGPSIQRALSSGKPALIDVVTDWRDLPSASKAAMSGNREALQAEVEKIKQAMNAKVSLIAS